MTSESKVSLLECLPERRRVRFPLGSPRRNMRNAHLCLPLSLPFSLTFPEPVLALIALPYSEQLHCITFASFFHVPQSSATCTGSHTVPPGYCYSPSHALHLHCSEVHFSICNFYFHPFQIQKNPYLISPPSVFLFPPCFNMAILERYIY